MTSGNAVPDIPDIFNAIGIFKLNIILEILIFTI